MFKSCGLVVQNLFTSRRLMHRRVMANQPPVLNSASYTPNSAQLRHGLSAAQPSSITEAAADLYTKSTGLITTIISLINYKYYYYQPAEQTRSLA